MSTENKSLPVPVIHKPTEGSLVTHTVSVHGTAEAGQKVQVSKADGSMRFFDAQVGKDGSWEGTLPKDLKGEVVITARLIGDNESSPWAPVRRFKVE
ncbi:hypothetical protein ACYZTM_08545 [Pseudomonas sp. MDT2-39-1]